MRRGGLIVLAALAVLSVGMAQAADTQTKTAEPAKPAATQATAPAAKAPAPTAAAQPAAATAAATQAADSPLVRAAKAAAAARGRDPKKRIVIDSTNLVTAQRSSSSASQ